MSDPSKLAQPSPLDFAREFTTVEDALIVDSADDVTWHKTADFVVVGFGGAGVAAANEAIDAGLSVLALDRFDGGGATTLNGGVVYFGGGTSTQKAADKEDTPEAMFEYLEDELGDVIAPETLRRFCESGPETIDWMEKHGCKFNPSAYSQKTSYPSTDYYLYHSDNSLLEKNRKSHPPAPRGHKVDIFLGKNASQGFGKGIFEPQRDAAIKGGVNILPQTEVKQLVLDKTGRVVGLMANHAPSDHPRYDALVKAQRAAQKWMLALPPLMPGAKITQAIADRFSKKAARIEAQATEPLFIRAERGVCLATGGFVFNLAMLDYFAPNNDDIMPLGTGGDDGSGILLGYSAGGALNRMDEISYWRFMNPPAPWAKGVLVNNKGERYADEASYGAIIGRAMMKPENAGQGWLILDQTLWDASKAALKKDNMLPFQREPARLTMWFKSKRAKTIGELAKKIGVLKANLEQTVSAYQKAKAGEDDDAFTKSPNDMGDLATGPFYALDLSVRSPFYPLPSITVGGLLVDEESGLVMRDDQSLVPGLYAAGRTAVGLCSDLYLSGLSSADCIFAGRRAARHASTRANTDVTSKKGVSAAFGERNFSLKT